MPDLWLSKQRNGFIQKHEILNHLVQTVESENETIGCSELNVEDFTRCCQGIRNDNFSVLMNIYIFSVLTLLGAKSSMNKKVSVYVKKDPR